MTQPKRKRTRYLAQRARAQVLLNAEDPPMPAARIGAIVRREFRSDGPSDRQVRNWINDGVIVVEPESAPWTVDHAEQPGDIPLVLDVIRTYRHPVVWVTVAQARWIVRLRRAYPAMDAIQALDLARHALAEDGLAFTRRLANLE